ncbi:AAEL007571-PA, partial [Aedes aegypti]
DRPFYYEQLCGRLRRGPGTITARCASVGMTSQSLVSPLLSGQACCPIIAVGYTQL